MLFSKKEKKNQEKGHGSLPQKLKKVVKKKKEKYC